MTEFPLRFAVVGHPVRQSASPAMHMAALRHLKLPHVYEAIDCPVRGSFERVVSLLKRGYFSGINVTSPYKADAVEVAGLVESDTQAIGAANTLRLRGGVVEASNTDLPAMVEQIQLASPRLNIALILGSGGAARAALAACQRLGVRVVGVTSRSWLDTEALYESPVAQTFRQQRALTFPWPQEGDSFERSRGSVQLQLQWREFAAMADLVIQATSAGLSEANPGGSVAGLIPWEKVPDHAVAYELIYGKDPTPFAQAAQRRGLRLLDGVELLARQGARSLSLWLKQPAPYEVMLEAARRHVLGLS